MLYIIVSGSTALHMRTCTEQNAVCHAGVHGYAVLGQIKANNTAHLQALKEPLE